MKKTFFSKILVITFFFGTVFANAQVRVKTNRSKSNKTVVKKTQKKIPNRAVRVKTNKNRVVVKKPNRPNRIAKRPNYNRRGYVWVEGYWKWNSFFGEYVWQKARWVKVKRNHYWIPGYWEAAAAGFFWVEGYWELSF